jgi:arylsulfatase A-like enzyme
MATKNTKKPSATTHMCAAPIGARQISAATARSFCASLWPIGLVALALLVFVTTSLRATERPNIIFLLTDDQGYGDLSCHGNPVLRTPHLDRLHGQSIRFTEFHATPLCTPTRATLLTGRSALRTGAWSVLGGHSLLRRDELTLPEVLAAGGYRTALFGKWHLGDSYPFRPIDRGFHESLTHGGGGIGTSPDWWGNDYTDDTFVRDSTEPIKLPGYNTDALFDHALRFIEQHRARPFYCQITTAAPHEPFNVPASYAEPYRGKVTDEVANFYGMIANLDENVGRLLARLDALGLAENTLLIFMTDNGSIMGSRAFNAGMRGNKGTPYEGGHRVPFFVRWPAGGLGAPRDLAGLTSAVDFFPTLVDLCGVKLPRPVTLDGVSLAPLLRGTGALPPDRVLVTGWHPPVAPQPYVNSTVMRGPWRLVRGTELYDVSADPAQKNDLAATRADIVAALRTAHDAWWRGVAPSFADVPRFVVGAPQENPTWLNAWDVHGQTVFRQAQVEQADPAHGYWEIEVAAAGDYEIALRRWPREVGRAINDKLSLARDTQPGLKPAVFSGASHARVVVAGRDVEQRFPADAREAVFTLTLPAGPTRLEASFINHHTIGGAVWGANYVRLRKL